MVADKGKKPKIGEDKSEIEEQIDVELVQSIEKLQEVQDELEKVHFPPILKLCMKLLRLVV